MSATYGDRQWQSIIPELGADSPQIRVPKQGHVGLRDEGQRHELGPGGFNYLPARMPHQAWASDDALVFITVDAGWDVNWVKRAAHKERSR